MAKRSKRIKSETLWMGCSYEFGFLPYLYSFSKRKRDCDDEIKRVGATKTARSVRVRITPIPKSPKKTAKKEGR